MPSSSIHARERLVAQPLNLWAFFAGNELAPTHNAHKGLGYTEFPLWLDAYGVLPVHFNQGSQRYTSTHPRGNRFN